MAYHRSWSVAAKPVMFLLLWLIQFSTGAMIPDNSQFFSNSTLQFPTATAPGTQLKSHSSGSSTRLHMSASSLSSSATLSLGAASSVSARNTSMSSSISSPLSTSSTFGSKNHTSTSRKSVLRPSPSLRSNSSSTQPGSSSSSKLPTSVLSTNDGSATRNPIPPSATIEIVTSVIIESGMSIKEPIITGGELSSPITLPPVTTTLASVQATSAVSSVSSRISDLMLMIKSWKANPIPLKTDTISEIVEIESDVEDLISNLGGETSGVLGLLSGVVNALTYIDTNLEDVAALVDANDVDGIETALSNLASQNGDLTNDENEITPSKTASLAQSTGASMTSKMNSDTSSRTTSTTSSTKSSTTSSATSSRTSFTTSFTTSFRTSSITSSGTSSKASSTSSYTSTPTALQDISSSIPSTVTTGGSTLPTTTTTYFPPTTIITKGFSVTGTTNTIYTSTPLTVTQPPCSAENGGSSCPSGDGPLSGYGGNPSSFISSSGIPSTLSVTVSTKPSSISTSASSIISSQPALTTALEPTQSSTPTSTSNPSTSSTVPYGMPTCSPGGASIADAQIVEHELDYMPDTQVCCAQFDDSATLAAQNGSAAVFLTSTAVFATGEATGQCVVCARLAVSIAGIIASCSNGTVASGSLPINEVPGLFVSLDVNDY